MTHDLITTNVQALAAKDLFTQPLMETIVSEMRARLEEFEPDTSTDKGRKEIASFAAKYSKSKTFIDKIGKDYVEPLKAEAKKTDSLRKYFRDECDTMKVEARRPLTIWEEAETVRVAAIVAKLEELKTLHIFEHDPALAEIDKNLDIAKHVTVDKQTFGEFTDQAQAWKDTAIDSLSNRIGAKRKSIADQAELDKLRKESEEREAEEYEAELNRKTAKHEKQLKKDAADTARIKAEKKAQDEKDEIEQEKQEAIDDKKAAEKALADAETKRIADIKTARQEERQQLVDEKKAKEEVQRGIEANQERIEATHVLLRSALAEYCGMTDEQSNNLIEATRAGKIFELKIVYTG